MKRQPTLQVFEFDRKWSLMKKMEMHIPDLNYAHDFLLFPNYYLFHITPFTNVGKWTAFQILSGWTSPGESMQYYPDKPSRFVVIPRNAKSEKEVICIDTDPCHVSLNLYFRIVFVIKIIHPKLIKNITRAKKSGSKSCFCMVW